MLDPALAQQLSAYLTPVVEPVELVSSLDASAASSKVADLLDEVASLSAGRVDHVRTGDAARRPSFRAALASPVLRTRHTSGTNSSPPPADPFRGRT